MPIQTQIIKANPGIKRDGTVFDGDFYTDGQWMRFQRGQPRKMGGYKSIVKTLSEISRGITNYVDQNSVYCHSGGPTTLERFVLDINQNSSVVVDRTPATLTDSVDNVWMFDYALDSSAVAVDLIAQVAPNGSNYNNTVGGQIFAGDALGTTALTAVTIPSGGNASGGIVMLHPYLFYYGAGGIVGWSVAGDPTDLSGTGSGLARPWGQKIIKGLPLRAGAGNAPAGLFWAYDAVLRASFTGGSTVFQFDVISTESSIMSPDAVIDYDGVFYWAGVDRFLMFNGVVREIPNTMNVNWFFDGLNKHQRAKVFSFKVPRFGEIWWAYPRGNATECTHAIVFNVRENTWYDTEMPATGRVAASLCNAYAAPLMVDTANDVWVHEQGVDEVDGQRLSPIKSYFETCDLSTVVSGTNSRLRLTMLEPDFIQSGDMTVQVTGRANAKASEVVSREYTFPEVATAPHEQVVMLKEQRRELRVKFTSNAVGGDYQMGQIIGHFDTGDHTVLG